MIFVPAGLVLLLLLHVVLFIRVSKEVAQVHKKMMVLYSVLAIIFSLSIVKIYDLSNTNGQVKSYNKVLLR